jgi:beta-N-acetylhexosaminidase
MALDDYDRLAGAVIVGGFDGLVAPSELLSRIADGRLAGVTIFKRNIESPLQLARLVDGLVSAARTGSQAPPLVSIDQEGGRVARLRAPLVELPPMRRFGEYDDGSLTRRALALLGAQLAALGCTTDFAPVADVDSNPANPVIGDRSFSRDPHKCATHVVAAIEGLRSSGVLACAKHFPGHGDTELDSHLALPVLRHDRARIDAIELPPFRAAIAAGVASVMTAHVVFEGVEKDLPATLSKKIVTDLLRRELGFAGVCFSDDLHMKAVADRYGIADSAVRSIEAGCDALLVCTDIDSHELARLALAARARTDAAFADRLSEAGGRLRAMRKSAPPAPITDAATLDAVWRSADAVALSAELRARAEKS